MDKQEHPYATFLKVWITLPPDQKKKVAIEQEKMLLWGSYATCRWDDDEDGGVTSCSWTDAAYERMVRFAREVGGTDGNLGI